MIINYINNCAIGAKCEGKQIENGELKIENYR